MRRIIKTKGMLPTDHGPLGPLIRALMRNRQPYRHSKRLSFTSPLPASYNVR